MEFLGGCALISDVGEYIIQATGSLGRTTLLSREKKREEKKKGERILDRLAWKISSHTAHTSEKK